MAIIAVPGCSQPSRKRWKASHPHLGWTENKEREREREREKERERDLQPIFAKYEIIFTVYNYHSVDNMLSYIFFSI